MHANGNRLTTLLVTIIIGAALLGCRDNSHPVAGPSMQSAQPETPFARTERLWREQRRATLLKPDGWTSLVGLHWLEPGAHFVGSAADNGVRLSMGPAHMGLVTIKGGQATFVPDKAATLTLDGQPLTGPATLRTDVDPAGPGVIGFDGGKGQATVILRNDRHALRVRHADAPGRLHFGGLDYWPAHPAWQVRATFIAHAPGTTMDVANVIGGMDAMSNPGVVQFERDGQTFRLEALDEGEGTLFLVFADRTSGHGSYGAGRFLDAPMPDAQGHVLVDFNQARNPPCAFSSFATCPLPPPENRLDLAITAGEKAYRHAGS
jgi:uncharacterized protein (DUF1684 family)